MFANRSKGLTVAFLCCPLFSHADPFLQQSKQTLDIPFSELTANIDGDLNDPFGSRRKSLR